MCRIGGNTPARNFWVMNLSRSSFAAQGNECYQRGGDQVYSRMFSLAFLQTIAFVVRLFHLKFNLLQ